MSHFSGVTGGAGIMLSRRGSVIVIPQPALGSCLVRANINTIIG